MTHAEETRRDWGDLLLLAAIGLLSIVFLTAVYLLVQKPYVARMHMHFLWRWPWIVTALVVLPFLIGIRIWVRFKGPRTVQKRRRIRRLDLLLLLDIAVLPMLLFWPPAEPGHDSPRPGAQVGQRYLLRGDNAAHLAKMQVNYLLYLPPEYEPSRPWPLVVYLHSHGLEGDNLAYVLTEGLPHEIERGRQFPFILVSPQQPGQGGWNPELVLELTDHISSTLPIDRDRVYLTGGSMGGFATWDVASHYPDRFAALVPVCGGGDPLLAKRLVNVPIWAFHGAKDNVVPIAWDQRMVDAVKKCGGQVKFTVYPDLGHGIGDVTYENDELFKWLLAQRRGPRQQRSPAAAKERKMP